MFIVEISPDREGKTPVVPSVGRASSKGWVLEWSRMKSWEENADIAMPGLTAFGNSQK
jgi:hypothetical protein